MIPDRQRPESCNDYWRCIAMVLLVLLLHVPKLAWASDQQQLGWQRVIQFFPNASGWSEPAGEFAVRQILAGESLLGYQYQSLQVTDIPAYSGKPINIQVLLNPDGQIVDAYVLEHHEPILLIGIPEQKLHDFSAKYQGIMADQRVVVGNTSDPDAVTVDAVTGATVTVMVVNEIIMRSAHEVAVSLGLIEDHSNRPFAPSGIKRELFAAADWQSLLGNGAIRRLHLTRAQVDQAFANTEAAHIDNAPPGQSGQTFIDLYVAQIDPPIIGRNLLGERQYQYLQQQLQPGEFALAVLASGQYSFKGSGYVRGGIFDRIQLRQFGDIISFRDLDQQRLSDLYIDGLPALTEMSVFIIRDHHGFDPGSPWSLELLVRRQTGPVDGVFTSFEVGYQLPEAYIERPVPSAEQLAAMEAANRPMWVNIWYQKSFQLAVVLIALLVLMVILFLQDKFTQKPQFLHWLRRGYLLFTVVFIGWYALGQLSVVNVLTFVHAMMQDFRWELFLIDPVIFVLWTFTAACILLWGRGVFCGWLCPFGALQELINEAARKLKVPQFELPFAVHERLWAIKYIILLVLFGISLESLASAERFAEVEPFKTAITLKFDRQWWFVLYAAILLVINIFTRKVYCRYICPLGAALAIPTKLKLFDWLKRRKDCGNPCKLCAIECEIQAIHPDGHIDHNECHYCLDCQMTYHNERKCPPLVAKNKKRQRAAKQESGQIPIVQIESQV
ncbi:transcriptional regulator NosR [Bowmanella denitrificans]|uniref:transcriptional regulator NosR n=1 Tax=Bowmanella denitrificans TaxID=366582 RepID=UPI001FE5522F|nr:NosR/NirI family protein [Bowmanella denitrificans]